MRGSLYSDQRDFSRSFAARDLGPPAEASSLQGSCRFGKIIGKHCISYKHIKMRYTNISSKFLSGKQVNVVFGNFYLKHSTSCNPFPQQHHTRPNATIENPVLTIRKLPTCIHRASSYYLTKHTNHFSTKDCKLIGELIIHDVVWYL